MWRVILLLLLAAFFLWPSSKPAEEGAPDESKAESKGSGRGAGHKTVMSSSGGKRKKRRRKSNPSTPSCTPSPPQGSSPSPPPPTGPPQPPPIAEEGVEAEEEKKQHEAPSTTSSRFTPGCRVEARSQGRSRYMAGTVKKVNRNGSLTIQYDDGSREFSISPDLVIAMDSLEEFNKDLQTSFTPQTAMPSLRDEGEERVAAFELTEGTRIEARWGGRAEYFPGVVTKVHHGGLCNIQYDDGEAETKVHPSMIRKPGEVLPVMASASNEDDEWTDGDEDDDDLDEEDDGWELVHRPKPTKASKAAKEDQRAAVANNLRNRKKKEKKREKNRLVREQFRESIV